MYIVAKVLTGLTAFSGVSVIGFVRVSYGFKTSKMCARVSLSIVAYFSAKLLGWIFPLC